MIKAIIELMLGKGGRYLLDVYNEYNLIINAVVIVYGVALIWGHFNLRQIAHKMEGVILKIAGESELTPDPAVIYEAFINQWKSLSETQKILIPSRNDLWLTFIPSQDLISILGIQPDYVRVVLSKAKIIDDVYIGSKQTYRAWELYRHQLLIGVRARHLEPDFQLEMRRKNSLMKKETSRAKPETKN